MTAALLFHELSDIGALSSVFWPLTPYRSCRCHGNKFVFDIVDIIISLGMIVNIV
jgi:hypothetical protein